MVFQNAAPHSESQRQTLTLQIALPSIQLKDLIGSVISLVSAEISFFYYRKNYALSRHNADRAIYMDGQKFAIGICKQLTAEPLLWCISDGDVMQQTLQQQFGKEVEDPKFQARLLGFAHLHLNMFEIVLAEPPNPNPSEPDSQSNVWLSYFYDTLTRSSPIRKVLEEPESGKIWSPVLLESPSGMSLTSSIRYPFSGSSRIVKLSLQTHAALETTSPFRLIPYWTILNVVPGRETW